MSDLHQLLHLGQVPPSPAFIAAAALAEGRREWEKVLSLVEAALAEAEGADGPESDAWKRAVNIGKVLHDVARANVQRVTGLERKVSLLAMLEAGRLRKAGSDDDEQLVGAG